MRYMLPLFKQKHKSLIYLEINVYSFKHDCDELNKKKAIRLFYIQIFLGYIQFKNCSDNICTHMQVG